MTAKLIGKECPERYNALPDETPTFQVSVKLYTLAARTTISDVRRITRSQHP